MDTYKENKITSECIVDLENMLVKIPMSHKDEEITVRWYMTNASYGYAYDVDANYMMSDTPEPFKAAKNSNNAIAGLDFKTACQFQEGAYETAYTHTPDSMNHAYVDYSLDAVGVGNYFSIDDGYLAIVDGWNNTEESTDTNKVTVASMFGGNALKYYVKVKQKDDTYTKVESKVTIQSFLTHFNKVTRIRSEIPEKNVDANGNAITPGEDVSNLFNAIAGKGNGLIHVDTNGDGVVNAKDFDVSADLGWVFGTCANDFLDGDVPSFKEGGRIICTNRGADGTVYFFYYCKSEKAQWAGGSFSLTPVLPKTGFLRIHKSSAAPALTDGNSCYNFANIAYTLYRDAACTDKVQEMWLDKYGYSQPVELNPGTYYFKETSAANSGYALDPDAHAVTVTAGTTKTAPQTWETTDQPLNDPFGIVINKISADGKATADLSKIGRNSDQ